jgi:TPR repeat protein
VVEDGVCATVKTCRKAAEMGNPAAQYELAMMYQDGREVPQDYVLAHLWFNLAAAQGHLDARKLRKRSSNGVLPFSPRIGYQ